MITALLRPVSRRLRTSVSVKVGTVLTIVGLILLKWWMTPRLTFNALEQEEIWNAPRDDVATRYEARRLSIIESERYDPHLAARAVGSPSWTTEGYPSLDARTEVYAGRLGNFAFDFLKDAPMRNRLDHAVGRVLKQVPPTTASFPRKLYSTGRFGDAGVPDMFRLWSALLPLPLGGDLEDQVPQTEWADPARAGAPWAVVIADESVMTTQLSAWIGDNISKGTGRFTQFWQKMSPGPQRFHLFKYMTMLFEGGVFATTDTVPIAHPFLWGLGAKSLLHPDLELIKSVLMKHASSSDATHRRLWERSVPDDPSECLVSSDVNECTHLDENGLQNETRTVGHLPLRQQLRRRGLFMRQTRQPDEATSILSPDVNLVIAIDWDSSLAFTPLRWAQWSVDKLKSSLLRNSPRRSLQFSPDIIMAKPYHPVFLDTLATIWAQVNSGDLDSMDPPDFSASGPFTDAVLRYLLVRYGVTPKHLRNLGGPVRIGDVLILQNGALSAPLSAVDRMLTYVQEFFPTLPGSGVAQAIPDRSLWYWGVGFRAWWSGGNRVATHLPGADEEEAQEIL